MVLVIDSGTTNTKALLFAAPGKLVGEAYAPTKTRHPGPRRVEQAAEEWWRAALAATGKLPAEQRTAVQAIVTSTQGGTFAPLDNDLKPLRPGITWLDNRSANQAAQLNRRHEKDFFYRRTGHHLLGWTPLSVICWLRKNEPETSRRTTRLSFVADYLNYKLTGRFFLDQTAAGMSTLFNINSGDWDADLLKIAGLQSGQLPDLVPAGVSGGTLSRPAAKILGLSEGIPVISGGHDQYCASLGAGAINPGDCLLSCGTAWALLVLTRKPVFKPGSSWTPGRHFQPGTFGLMGAISNGGVVLDWLRKNLRLQASLVNSAPAGDSRVLVTTRFSEGRGSIKNLSLAVESEDIYYAALKDLARQVSACLGQLKDAVKLKRIFLVGGGAKEPLLLPIIAHNTKLEVIAPDINEAAARGAALLAIKSTVKNKTRY